MGATIYRYRLEKNGVGGVADVKDLDALEARNVLRHVLAVTRVGRLGLIDRAEEEMLPDRDVTLISVAFELDHQLGVPVLRNVYDAEAIVGPLEGQATPEGEVAVDVLEEESRVDVVALRVEVLAVRVLEVCSALGERGSEHPECQERSV